MTDLTPRMRKLRSTGAMVFYHPCTHEMPDGSLCGKEAPYGYGVYRQSRGRWVKDGKVLKWRGQDPQVDYGRWRCPEHKE